MVEPVREPEERLTIGHLARIHIPPPDRYMVILDKFHISTTRSLNDDTDYVTLTAQVNQQKAVNKTVFVGDVDDGDHHVNLHLGPFKVGPNDTLAFNYVVLHKGFANGDRQKVEDALAAAAIAAIAGASGEVSGVVAAALTAIVDFIKHGCDGNCAARQFKFTGTGLARLTSGTGSLSETLRDEFESPDGCGDSGVYTVTWRILRVAL